MRSCRSARPLFFMREQDAAETAALRHGLFHLPANLHAQLTAEARAAYPNECCGLIEGVRTADTIEARALHPTRNLAESRDRFEIDPAEHIRLLRSLRGTGRDIVGCYHSHPDGASEPSPRDRDRAGEEDFVWLVASVKADDACGIAAFVFSAGDFTPLR
jgi:proteasome lid subunit RPN8/RPN11